MNGASPAARATEAVDLGDVSIRALLDAHGSFTTFRSAFPTAGDDVERVGRTRYGELFAGDAWVLPFRAFLVTSAASAVLIDAGIGPPPGDFLPERQGLLLSELEAAGVGSEDVDVVFLTHLHVDHVGWTVGEDEPVFANARYVTCRDDWRFFERREQSRATFATKLAPLERADLLELVPAAEVELVPGVVAFPTPGHTPGHMSVRVGGRDRDACVLGDVAVHPLQVDESGLTYSEEVDPALAAATRRSLLHPLAAAKTVVAAGHFPGSGFGTIADSGRRLHWRALDHECATTGGDA
jgi:glyoxylase-like metal-dependent hydrolase (beta-lactamase superfamily II)